MNSTSSPQYTMTRDWYVWRNAKLVILPMAAALFFSNFFNTIWVIRKTFKLYRLQRREKMARRVSSNLEGLNTHATDLTSGTSITATHDEPSRYPTGYSSAYRSTQQSHNPTASGISKQGTVSLTTSTVGGHPNMAVPFPPTPVTRVVHWFLLAQSALGFATIVLQLLNYYEVDKPCAMYANLVTVAYFVGTAVVTLCTGLIIATGELRTIPRFVNYAIIPVAIGLKVYALLASLGYAYVTWRPLCEYDVARPALLLATLIDLSVWVAQLGMLLDGALGYRRAFGASLGTIFRTGNAGCLLAAGIVGILTSLGIIIQGEASSYSLFPCWFVVWVITSKLVLESFAEGLKSCLRIYAATISQSASCLPPSGHNSGGTTSGGGIDSSVQDQYAPGSKGTSIPFSVIEDSRYSRHSVVPGSINRHSQYLYSPGAPSTAGGERSQRHSVQDHGHLTAAAAAGAALGHPGHAYTDDEAHAPGIPMDQLPIYKPSASFEGGLSPNPDGVSRSADPGEKPPRNDEAAVQTPLSQRLSLYEADPHPAQSRQVDEEVGLAAIDEKRGITYT
ncbi:hypothetical protein IWQ60_000751 [Tieghemiomyces parasiticus]|uniref:Transmembrane protein n=1 Tax=Tieghemiomyces parasiticus TaxID=78921 RepID=A0A9W8E362_9FUNG|nr:hypothetical protein IWQ60_000751 [Tieghemiomyces parasiticus]